MANDTEFGLAGYFFSRDSDRIWRVADQMDVGMIGANTGAISQAIMCACSIIVAVRYLSVQSFRRCQGERLWPRGRHGGHQGVPDDQGGRARYFVAQHQGVDAWLLRALLRVRRSVGTTVH